MKAAGKSGRHRRAILLAGQLDSGIGDLLRKLADKTSAHLHSISSLSDRQTVVSQEGDHICLTVIDAKSNDLLALARDVHRVAPASEFVFLGSEADESVLRKQFGPAPRIGTHWHFVSSDNASLARVLASAFQRADQRRSTRTTLDRFNARLSSPVASVDTREMRQLVISDRFLSSILESAFDAVLLVDRAGNIAAFNPSAERLFQRPKTEVLSSPVRDLADGQWRDDVNQALRTIREDGLLQSSICIDEQQRHIEISATPVYDQSNNLVATSLIVRDVTQRMLSEDALRTNEKLAAVGRLASSIAHEINNPLESVTNLLYLARQSAETPELQEYLDLADQELRRVSNITNQTLRFHKQATAPKAVSCEDLIGGALAIFQGRLSNYSISVEKRKRAHRPVVCFEGEIRQVLNNLIGNAIDAMPLGGRLILRSRESTTPKDSRRGLLITVADTGSGMSAKTLKKVFEPFFTTKGIGGTGLGLWISREIVERHQGSLLVRSSQNQSHSGTVFELFLPYEASIRGAVKLSTPA